jgi:hypothetical protein
MKRSFLLLAFFILSLALFKAQTPNWQWAKSASGTDSDYGLNSCTDTAGNLYIAGNFSSPSLSFGSSTITCAGQIPDGFLAKYDPSGNELWARSFSGSNFDYVSDIATDAAGNVLVAGHFSSLSFTIGNTVLSNFSNVSNGSADFFLAKFDGAGNLLWARKGGDSGTEYGGGVRADSAGNIWLAGAFGSQSLSIGNTVLNNMGSGRDIFLVKYDAAGNVLLVQRYGGSSNESAPMLSLDAASNIFLAGAFSSTVLVVGSTTLTNVSTNGVSEDLFLARLDANANPLWAISTGGSSGDGATSVSADPAGNVFIGGAFNSQNLVIGTSTLTKSGTTVNAFVAKYSATGTPLWASSSATSLSYKVHTDAGGNAYATGYFQGPTVTFGNFVFNNAANTPYNLADGFLVKYNGAGNVQWAIQAGGTRNDIISSVCTDLAGNVFVTGSFDSPTLAFGNTTLSNPALFEIPDLFVARLGVGFTGIHETAARNTWRLAPNPFHTEAVLEVTEPLQNASLILSDCLGRQVQQQHGLNGLQVSIKRQELPAGVYVLSLIQQNKAVCTGKLVISD